MRKDFAIFILTNGRSSSQKTYGLLQKIGYSGNIYFVADSGDKTLSDLKEKYGNKVLVFSKKETFEAHKDNLDLMDNFDPDFNDNVVIFARYAVQDFAKELSLKHYLVLDDDYVNFKIFDFESLKYSGVNGIQFEKICDYMCQWLDSSPLIKCVAFMQQGDVSAGFFSVPNGYRQKVMNSFFCSTEKPLIFTGRLNEDVNAYLTPAKTGELYFSVPEVIVKQFPTQQNKGGLTNAYLDYGTYVKSFYALMANPSCVKIERLHSGHRRIHHKITRENAGPKIIREEWKKK